MILPTMNDAKKRTNKSTEYIYREKSKFSKFLNNKKYFLKTYGCQMNVHDSEEIRAHLESVGAEETIELDNTDIVILNTCAIRENAHDKVFGFLGRCKHLKNHKNITIIFCGCMAQEESVVNEIKEKYPYIDIVVGTHNIHEIIEKLYEDKQYLDISVYSIEGNVYENVLYKRDSKIKAWVNIMYGCDKFCTYCIVPYTRGKQRSRLPKFILEEVQDLIKNNYQ